MLLFSTILNIDSSLTKDDFIKLVIEWNQGSPHEDNIIPNIKWNGERNIKFSHEKLWLEIEEYRNKNIIAVRYEKKLDDGVVWDTDYIMNFETMKMSIMLDRSFTDEALQIDNKFSTPHFITLLIEKGYILDDNGIAVSKRPVIVNENNIDLLANIINQQTNYSLPVVYVSKSTVNNNPVNIDWLASRLKGVAHVFVQEDISTNSKLNAKCDGKNEFLGAIGVYYPSPNVLNKRFLYNNSIHPDITLNRVVNFVIQYSNAQLVEPLYTWQGVKNELLRDKLTSQKQKKEEAIVNQDEAFAWIEEIDEKVEQLTNENERLTQENQGLKNRLDAHSNAGDLLLCRGEEEDLFSEEIKDMILSVLNDGLNHIDKGTRKYAIVKDVIDNNEYHGLLKEKSKRVKELFKSYDGLTKKLRQELKELGFTITEEGKHYKLTYCDDNRYTFTIAKTPSDNRAGKNNASTIANKIF